MKKSLLHIILITLLIGSLSACATSESITSIDYLEPGKIIFPERVEHVAVLNNSPIVDEMEASSVLRFSNTKRADIFAGFINELAQSGYYDQITIADAKWTNPQAGRLELTTLKEMEEAINPDFIISISALNPEDLDIPVENDDFIANSLIAIQPVFQLYNPKTKKSTFYQPQDTVNLFDALILNAISSQYPNENFSDREEFKGSNIIAKQLAAHFVPHWKTVERVVFTDQPLFAASAKNISNNNLDQAIQENELIYTKNKKPLNKIKAANNIAYLYELKDQLNTAYAWSNIALELATDLYGPEPGRNIIYSYVQSYNTTLKERIEAMDILNQQLSKFEY